MSIIFSTSSLALPGTLARFTGLSALKNVAVVLNPGGALYLPTNILLIAFFNYYYTFLQLDPDDVSEQLKRPTLKILRDGGKHIQDYKGTRNADGIVEYLKKRAGPASAEIKSSEDADKFISEKKIYVVGVFFEFSGEEKATLEELGASPRVAGSRVSVPIPLFCNQPSAGEQVRASGCGRSGASRRGCEPTRGAPSSPSSTPSSLPNPNPIPTPTPPPRTARIPLPPSSPPPAPTTSTAPASSASRLSVAPSASPTLKIAPAATTTLSTTMIIVAGTGTDTAVEIVTVAVIGSGITANGIGIGIALHFHPKAITISSKNPRERENLYAAEESAQSLFCESVDYFRSYGTELKASCGLWIS